MKCQLFQVRTMTYLSSQKINIAVEIKSYNLVTRDQGSKLVSLIAEKLKTNELIVIDFTGVLSLSPSFADELFNGLKKELGETFSKKIKILCDKPEWRKLIQTALNLL